MNFLRRLWQKRFIRVTAYLLGTLITLYGVLFAWVNYSGAQGWAATQAMLQREHETLDFRSLLPSAIPDATNYCAIPALKDLPLVIDHDSTKGDPGAKRKRLNDTALPSATGPKPFPRPPQAQGATLGVPTDLKAWADYLRKEGSLPTPPYSGNPARDILSALSRHDALFTELAAGLDRPEASWTPEWKSRQLPEMLFAIELPHYGATQSLVSTLALRATAAARAGDPTTARQSLLIALRLARASLNDRFLIGELVGCGQSALINGALWEMCAAHAGTVEDYRLLQEELSRLDFEKALLQAVRSEMATGVDTVLYLKRRMDPKDFSMLYAMGADTSPPPGFLARTLFRLTPGGLFYMNATTIAELDFHYLVQPLRDHGLTGSLAQSAPLDSLLQEMPNYRVDKILAKLALPAFVRIINRTAYTHCINRQAIVACALEQWYLEHHQYPDTLTPLGPTLPIDPLTSQPMGYRLTPDGRYTLWCIGFDGKDDHGTRTLQDPQHPATTKFASPSYQGDWVWSFQP